MCICASQARVFLFFVNKHKNRIQNNKLHITFFILLSNCLLRVVHKNPHLLLTVAKISNDHAKTARVRKMIPSQVKNTSSYCFWRYLLLAVQSIIFLHEFFLLQVIIETASGRHEITGRTILNYFRVSICRLFLSRHLKITERGRRK